MSSKQDKIQKLQNAIEAIRALGDGYEGYVYVAEKLQDEVTVLMQSEKESQEKAKKQADDKAWSDAYWARYEAEQQHKQELTEKIPQLRKAVQDASDRVKSIADYNEWPKLDYQWRTAVAELEEAEKQLRWL